MALVRRRDAERAQIESSVVDRVNVLSTGARVKKIKPSNMLELMAANAALLETCFAKTKHPTQQIGIERAKAVRHLIRPIGEFAITFAKAQKAWRRITHLDLQEESDENDIASHLLNDVEDLLVRCNDLRSTSGSYTL